MPRSIAIVTSKPGKEFRASEEVMDVLMYFDQTVWCVKLLKGLSICTTNLTPREAEEVLKGRVFAYVNQVLIGNELCYCPALKKGCLIEVPEGDDAFCVGKAVVRIGARLKAKRGILVSVKWK
ncbi:hypothetical protein EYM_05200 [Ignicoccus islandicus DSM 13165]|uniref:Uncharacterized protein n=1 Tax=Ignicoccus islandicus DSM 13165 TaxID=940295 RepID=A0A0U3F4T1_9CREN|nr:hypothetical protein EYM_05200 [Ignicoccus islandicus DSM 13165]